VYDAGDGDLNATFVRRDVSVFEPDRRLAELAGTITENDVAGFNFEWTPIGGDPTAFPRIGFFDSTTMADVAVLAPTDNRYELDIGRGQPDAFHIENVGFNYTNGETYLLELLLDGPSGTATLSSSVKQAAGFVHQGTNAWSFSTSYTFDTLGIGNTVDVQFGATFDAEFASFSFIPEPSTALLVFICAGLFSAVRRKAR